MKGVSVQWEMSNPGCGDWELAFYIAHVMLMQLQVRDSENKDVEKWKIQTIRKASNRQTPLLGSPSERDMWVPSVSVEFPLWFGSLLT